ncbi:MAG: D-alanine--D-alanine ligase, partial [Clostridia bacterium]|nr:D-alanine--D-alanine ligase [Clostridia bacterium]
MDKTFTKCIINELGGIIQAKAVVLRKKDYTRDPEDAIRDIDALGYPLFVKPARAGSSVGVTKVTCRGKLDGAIETALAQDDKILVEECIDGREIEVAVMESGGVAVASDPGEIDPGFDFYDYDTKYQNDTA